MSVEVKLTTPPGVEIRTSPSGKQSLRIGFYYQGKQRRETLIGLKVNRSGIKAADRLRSEIINRIKRGDFNYKDYFPEASLVKKQSVGLSSAQTNLGELLRCYLDRSSRTLERSTYKGYQQVCEHYLIPRFGDLEITVLRPYMLRDWIAELKVTTKTLNNILIPLRGIIDQCLNDGLIEFNPLSRLVPAKLIAKEYRKSDYDPKPFKVWEIKAIINAAYHAQCKNLFQFAFYTGLRISELIGLQWEDVDWEGNKLYVRRAIVDDHEKGTKTAAGTRKIELLRPALEALEKQKAYTLLKHNYVFHFDHTGRRWKDSKQIHRVWVRTLNRTKVEYRNTYQCRHTYASMMLSSGEPLMWVVDQLGHVDAEMVIKVYARWIPDERSKDLGGKESVENRFYSE